MSEFEQDATIDKNSDTLKKAEKPHYTGHRSRLRERLLTSSRGSLPDYEILEILLFNASPRGDVKPLAKSLLKEFGSLSKVISATPEDLRRIGNVKDNTIANFRAVHEAIERILKEEVKSAPIINNWKSLVDYCRSTMSHLKKEQFRVMYLDTSFMLIADDIHREGTIDQTPVYPREIVKRTLELEASHIVLVHNHPSGKLDPSKADIDITLKIKASIMQLGVKLIDHIIVGSTGHYSFKSNGLI